ncbi:MAG: DedA family protein [Chloroflexi bacterium]|nr:DedA family protein [Chloroflexota bacterium]
MGMISTLVDYFLHLDKYLSVIIQNYGVWTYLILFVIIYCETGLVVTPYLPGDSLLFAAGTFAALGSLNVVWLAVILMIAAVAGDATNYSIGHYLGPKVFDQKRIPFLKREHLERTHQFYEKHGGKTIFFARFIPIIRTFAPFVAGIGKMTYSHFASYNIIGGVVWVCLFVFGGFFFGNLPAVRENFTLVILAIIVISFLPPVIEYSRKYFKPAQNAVADE